MHNNMRSYQMCGSLLFIFVLFFFSVQSSALENLRNPKNSQLINFFSATIILMRTCYGNMDNAQYILKCCYLSSLQTEGNLSLSLSSELMHYVSTL